MAKCIDLSAYIKNRIRNSKDITKVFKNLEKQNFNIATNNTKVFEDDYFITNIENKEKYVFIDVIWRNHTELNNAELSNGFKQEIFMITY